VRAERTVSPDPPQSAVGGATALPRIGDWNMFGLNEGFVWGEEFEPMTDASATCVRDLWLRPDPQFKPKRGVGLYARLRSP